MNPLLKKFRFGFVSRQLIALVFINSIPLIFVSTELLSESYSHLEERQEFMLSERLSFISSTVASAVLFDDDSAAQEILSALKQDSDVRYARIYNPDNTLFSEYSRLEKIDDTGFDTSNEEIAYDGSKIYLRRQIVLDDEYLGFVTMSADIYYPGYGGRNEFYLALLAVIFGSLSVVFFLNWFVQRRLNAPINSLIELVSYVSQTKRYDRQLKVPGDEDFSRLFIVLNEMLNNLNLYEKERQAASAQMIQASKLATLGEMATSVAHELNQPLQIIRLAVANLRQKPAEFGSDPDYLLGKLDRIDGQAERAAVIIDHMRMFGREAKEALEPVDPRRVITNALELMGEQLRLDDIEVVMELPEDCSLVMGHVIQMEQIILNLLTNSRDAIDDNGGERIITLRVFESPDGVHISSEDTGGGIPEEVLPRIFEPFYTTKGIDRGTGLGLSVAYGIVRDMKGAIAAENTDAGARFTITLPPVH